MHGKVLQAEDRKDTKVIGRASELDKTRNREQGLGIRD
jgi:hypothetical protein